MRVWNSGNMTEDILDGLVLLSGPAHLQPAISSLTSQLPFLSQGRTELGRGLSRDSLGSLNGGFISQVGLLPLPILLLVSFPLLDSSTVMILDLAKTGVDFSGLSAVLLSSSLRSLASSATTTGEREPSDMLTINTQSWTHSEHK